MWSRPRRGARERVLTDVHGFALLALVLGATGSLASSHDVASRRAELALRIALRAIRCDPERNSRQGGMVASVSVGGLLSIWGRARSASWIRDGWLGRPERQRAATVLMIAAAAPSFLRRAARRAPTPDCLRSE